jgi:hypothetical protein
VIAGRQIRHTFKPEERLVGFFFRCAQFADEIRLRCGSYRGAIIYGDGYCRTNTFPFDYGKFISAWMFAPITDYIQRKLFCPGLKIVHRLSFEKIAHPSPFALLTSLY